MIRKLFKALQKDERGVSALEYAILAGVIVVVIAAALTTFGGKLTTAFENLGDKIDTQVSKTN
ncbi:Flp family type IVb pilin [Brenneria sp. 4F2]|nr:Flp family type IVb pilin [Brenneria bubanii]